MTDEKTTETDQRDENPDAAGDRSKRGGRRRAKPKGKLTGQAMRKHLDAGDKWDVFIPKPAKRTDPKVVHLGTINGAAYHGKAGTTVSVPIEIAVLAHRSGAVQGEPPPGAHVTLRSVGTAELQPATTPQA